MRHLVHKIIPLLLLVLMIGACEDTTPNLVVNDNPLDFNAPSEGQKAYFQRYTSSCDNVNDDFEFTGDVLEVELIRQQGDFYLQESFTKESPLYEQGNTDPVLHKITFTDDYVLIPERSRSTLFFFYGNDTIHLKPSQKEVMTQNACRIDLGEQIFVGNEIGNINSFQIGPLVEVNKTVVACVPVGLNLDAYLIYDENKLLMSHTVGFGGVIMGWYHMD